MSEIDMLPDILTVGEVAAYLRVSATTVWRWCSTGRLPAFRIGRSWRVRRSDLELNISRAVSDLDLPGHAAPGRPGAQ